MKKALAVLAVVAMAAAAHADLVELATWETSGGTVSQAEVIGLKSVSDLALYGNAGDTSAGIFGVNKLTDGASGIKFTVAAEDNYEITGATLAATYTGSATGPKQIDFLVNGGVVTTHARPTRGSSFDVMLGDLGSSATVALVANVAAGTVRSGTKEAFSNTAGSFGIRTSMTLSGNVVEKAGPTPSVPEPATMSLLGLGALALALRRKLRK